MVVSSSMDNFINHSSYVELYSFGYDHKENP